MTLDDWITKHRKDWDEVTTASVPEWEPGMNPWTPGFWYTETQIIRPKPKKKRYPSSKGYGSRL